ncbi:MAG: hypothetical protein GX896_04875, partial [Clostridiales bacterium]|nr:hypothetical protein [Clostridiales bacterium]
QTHKINATITESGNAKAFIKYSSSDTSIAQVDSEGLITGVKGGKTTIKIFDEETQSSKEINVEIISQLENIAFSSDSASIEVGESFTPTVLLSPEDTSDKSYTLSITPENIAEIKDGKITGLSTGTATLTATHTLTNKTATMKITVSEKVKSINLSFVSTEIRVGKTTTISAKVLPDSALDKNIKWTTSDPSVAAVWGSGDSTATIKGVSKGTCKIRATSINNPSIYAESTITVTGPVTTIPPNETNTETYIGGILIVNKTYGLPKSYNRNGGLTAETQAAFNKMKAAAKANGISLWVASGYRSYERQKTLFESYLNRPNSSQTDVEEYSARPGFSEHQTGMAIDVNSPSDSFYGTPEQKWLDQHCAEYGFIIRYPKDKQSVTGYKFEPWHIRYVGVDNAKAITNAGLCLEEYLGVTSVYANKNY